MGKSSYEELEKELKELKNSDIRPLKKDHYENLFDNMSEMVEVIELIYDKNNQPIDFYIRAINTSLAKFLGKTKKQLINKKISSIVDRIEENWFTYFAKVDKTGEPLRFKNYGVAFDKYYFVSVWKVSKKTVGVSFTDITKTEKDKIKLNKKLENETKVRTEAEFLVKNGKLELHQTINSLDTAQKQIIYQNKTKGENSWELRRIKAELEQQSFYLNNVAIVSETDADFNILFVNDNFCEIYGYPREELIGQNHRILKSGKQPEAFFTDMITTIVSGGVFKGEVLNKRNGTEEYYWMDLTIMPFKDLNGKIIRFVAIMFDITDQYKQKEILLNQADELVLANKELAFQNEEKGKRADELAIAKKELIFQKELDSYRSEAERVAHELTLLIDTANAPIFGIDSKGLVNEWNQTSEKITGFKKDEVLGKNLVQTYITEDYRESVKKVLDDALRGKETANYEFPLFTKSGERVMVLLNSSSRRDANGKITGVLGVGQDITELVGYRNELEIKVEERTVKLNQALEKQKELNELKSKFVSTASHEFRTPLSAINFAAGSIKKYWGKMEPVMVEKKLHKIEDQVMHMTRLLDDVLVIGQAGAGKTRNNPLNMPLGNFINEIIEEVYTSHKKSNKIVVIDTANIKNETIFIDEKLGRNIFINLISNAVKYSKNKENVTIAFSSEKDFIIVTVTDSGIGISKSELKTIFTPFSRGEHVDLIQGTGLGLSIAKEAIDTIGGEIVVRSTLGYGATFKVKIPKNKKNV